MTTASVHFLNPVQALSLLVSGSARLSGARMVTPRYVKPDIEVTDHPSRLSSRTYTHKKIIIIIVTYTCIIVVVSRRRHHHHHHHHHHHQQQQHSH
jgi:hypothetical protein